MKCQKARFRAVVQKCAKNRKKWERNINNKVSLLSNHMKVVKVTIKMILLQKSNRKISPQLH